MKILNIVKPTRLILIVLLATILESGWSQSIIDSLKSVLDTAIHKETKMLTLLELGYKHLDTNPILAYNYSSSSLRLAKELGDSKRIEYAYSDMAYSYYVRENLDSFRIILEDAIAYLKANEMHQELPVIYRNLAKIGEMTSDPDTSHFYLDQCIAALEKYPDSLTLGDVHLSKGFAYRTQGYFNISLKELFTALNIFKAIGSKHKMSYAYQNIGINNAIMENLPEAIYFSNKACEIFEERKNIRALAQTKNNLGKMYEDLGKIDSSRINHRASIIYSEQIGQNWVLKQNFWNLGRMEYEAGILDSARYWLERVNEMAQESDDRFLLGGTERYFAKIAASQGNRRVARNHLLSSLDYLEIYQDPSTLQEAYNDYSDLYEQLGEYEEAFTYNQKARDIQDSLYSLKKDQQIAELNLIYETEKKDAEIQLLEQRAQIDQAQKKLLWGGIVFSLLLGSLIVYTIWQRRRKDKLIHQQEQAIEIEKRKNAEIQLEYKKKELTAKVLQLARKNEFLQDLEDQIRDLKTTSDDRVKRTSLRLARMINHDTREDEEWEQFVKSFTSVHQGFIDGLIKKHGPLSKNDLRLISLLKMNLSSKDIASTLRISNEGIKKARYRLRKKLSLNSEMDLQEYLHAFN